MGGRRQRQADLAKAANAMQEGQARALDDLTEFETFREMFAPEIRRALVKGLSEKQIMDKFKPFMAARLVQIGGLGRDGEAISAIREIFDRLEGKPVAKQEHTHKLARLPENELDAILENKLKRLAQATIDVTPSEEDDEE
jgi:hypothetical protein